MNTFVITSIFIMFLLNISLMIIIGIYCFNKLDVILSAFCIQCVNLCFNFICSLICLKKLRDNSNNSNNSSINNKDMTTTIDPNVLLSIPTPPV